MGILFALPPRITCFDCFNHLNQKLAVLFKDEVVDGRHIPANGDIPFIHKREWQVSPNWGILASFEFQNVRDGQSQLIPGF